MKDLFKLISLYRQKMDSSEFQFTESNIYQLDDLLSQLINKFFKSFNDVALDVVLSLKASIIDIIFEPNPDVIIIKKILDIVIEVLNLELLKDEIKMLLNNPRIVF